MPRRRPTLRHIAAQQAHAEYDPQIHGVKRETHQQVRSIRSSGPALQSSLQQSAHELRHAGLAPRDLTIALSELAHRTADVGASTALQTQQARQAGHGEVVDLLQGRGQAQKAALAGMQQQQAEHAQDIQDEERSDARDFKMGLLKEEAEKKLGLGDYAGGGLTATQRRDAGQSHHNAAFYAKQYFQASKGGITDPKTGEVLIPPDPKSWDESTWNALAEKVAGQKGVNSVHDAQRAVAAIRDHVGGTPNLVDTLKALALGATTGAAVAGPGPLQPIAQFGTRLLRR
jgi:hypothetical protein